MVVNHFDNYYNPFLYLYLCQEKQAMDDLNRFISIQIMKIWYLRLKRTAEKTRPNVKPNPKIRIIDKKLVIILLKTCFNNRICYTSIPFRPIYIIRYCYTFFRCHLRKNTILFSKYMNSKQKIHHRLYIHWFIHSANNYI